MEIRVNVPDEIATQAQARGVPVETYVEELLTREATVIKKVKTPQDVRKWLDSLAQFSDKIPPLPATLTREWIYRDHD